MNIVQAILIGIFGYLSSNYNPWGFGQLLGWYGIGRPLVSGLVIGIIMGDVSTGILMGAAVQTLYIGLVTPGLSMPADLNTATYIGIPLAMASGASTEFALTLAVPLSALGVALVYVVQTVNVFWVRKMDKWIDEGNIKQAGNVPLYASSSQAIARFVPIFIACYFGQGFITSFVETMPSWLGDTFVLFGRMLPAVGFAMLLRMCLNKTSEIIYFLAGFIMVAALKLPITVALVVACLLGYLDMKYSSSDTVVKNEEVMFDD
ncbi:MAG: PTS mannose/fructose/sorbose/N-acetylgalactosamine transporter subunit IIC [Traorella sp.]